ncbi:hypothetical protein [Paraliobacillus ryukyuensis]|uniref:hypothetical protein n=1 Tax=Paraliobacillus ryukyuensis TaxID=200904 RepID=UPI0009A6EE1B|nr:hypothetical protein [Paraliobacillus ryukyuensis]
MIRIDNQKTEISEALFIERLIHKALKEEGYSLYNNLGLMITDNDGMEVRNQIKLKYADGYIRLNINTKC